MWQAIRRKAESISWFRSFKIHLSFQKRQDVPKTGNLTSEQFRKLWLWTRLCFSSAPEPTMEGSKRKGSLSWMNIKLKWQTPQAPPKSTGSRSTQSHFWSNTQCPRWVGVWRWKADQTNQECHNPLQQWVPLSRHPLCYLHSTFIWERDKRRNFKTKISLQIAIFPLLYYLFFAHQISGLANSLN